MEKCFDMLQKGRVDLVIANIPDAHNGIDQAGLDRRSFQPSEIVISDLPHHLLVSKKVPNAQQIH